MQRKVLLWLYTLTLMVVLALPQVVNGQMGPYSMGQHHLRLPFEMNGNRGRGQSSDAQTIHQLFVYHDQIQRMVEEIPGGIRTVTESDNSEVASLIQSHVAQMYNRIDQGRPIPMIGMSSTLPTMIEAADQYQRQFRLIPKGIEITETSNDPEMVAIIREHAQEVTRFAVQGMPVMMNRRMR